MESEKIVIGNFTLECYSVNTIIIGSGAAALNAAASLHNTGQNSILIVTSEWGGGTSNNAGSDKQTYYKLSLSGTVPDSVSDMAKDLFNGKCMHGDIALCEAQGSVRAFMNLVNLGVKFPLDKYGSWPGYKTDHDQRGRATSAGPYTSKRMFEALAADVLRREINILNHHHCIALLTDAPGSRVTGALAINTEETDYKKAFVLFNSSNIILGTGGPAGIYKTSVYPVSQNGSTGMAFIAGATGQNLTESQFGIASLKFRWNLSGSYQQSVPRYISTDKEGDDEKEFLNEFFPDLTTLTKAIFLKGYQWPFDPGKINNHGSSLIDILVHREINEKGRKVFLDYTRNPSWGHETSFSVTDLDPEARDYLRNSGALKDLPFERLLALNAPAIALYRDNGIDLSEELLQIAVCAQHNNGGLTANIWWESDLAHLFPVGEVNGSHGVYRPGGCALNSGQVGSFRAAQFISKKYKESPPETSVFFSEVRSTVEGNLTQAELWMGRGDNSGNDKYLVEIRKRMSEHGGIIRNRNAAEKALAEAEEMLKRLPSELGAASVVDLADSFLIMDNCITHFIYLSTIRHYIKNGGRSRGSYIITKGADQNNKDNSVLNLNPELCTFDRDIENKILEVRYKDQIISLKLESVRELPVQDLWFEKVWKEYLEDNYPDC